MFIICVSTWAVGVVKTLRYFSSLSPRLLMFILLTIWLSSSNVWAKGWRNFIIVYAYEHIFVSIRFVHFSYSIDWKINKTLRAFRSINHTREFQVVHEHVRTLFLIDYYHIPEQSIYPSFDGIYYFVVRMFLFSGFGCEATCKLPLILVVTMIMASRWNEQRVGFCVCAILNVYQNVCAHPENDWNLGGTTYYTYYSLPGKRNRKTGII